MLSVDWSTFKTLTNIFQKKEKLYTVKSDRQEKRIYGKRME